MVLVIATAGLVYELVMAAVASYVLGDSVTQFSTIIGLYLSALGLGAYISKFIDRRLALTFVDVELAAALIGGASAPLLFLAFSYTAAFHFILYGMVLVVGTLVGLELPLLMRLLGRELSFKDLIARALTFDYAGALIGSLGFSLLLVPKLGLARSSLVCGLLNAGVALVSTWILPSTDAGERRSFGGARVRAVLVLLILAAGILESERVTGLAESALFPGKVIFAEHSRYQRIVLTERQNAGHKTFQLQLNGNLQFDTADEYRYHEALVHPAMQSARQHAEVAVGGGGDGLAAREILRWPGVERITLVDLDPAMTELGKHNPLLKEQNRGAMNDPRMEVHNSDAMVWFRDHDRRFDVIILDFPDPTNYSLGKLYSARFYRTIYERLADDGALVVQSTSPLFALQAYWCINATLRSVGFSTAPYHVFVPAFGEWGYVLAKKAPFVPPRDLQVSGLAYLTPETLRLAFSFPEDMQPVATPVNRLDNQALVHFYLDAWSRWQ
ncbi:MAG: polyamine aminopropyltransferase [Polyangiaceae bacterium]|nr:polyamine aminopropyltransferase [Myxococcales bacterium]MCB9583859.1 polyamine aminopropyltransferase [Polyangiaceae bacterium]MCB9607885.1 polyamine aminopropyltransferase [Polyangiaceae bacterium]